MSFDILRDEQPQTKKALAVWVERKKLNYEMSRGNGFRHISEFLPRIPKIKRIEKPT